MMRMVGVVVQLLASLCFELGPSPSPGGGRGPRRRVAQQRGTEEEIRNKPAHAVPLASARQQPENQKENQPGHSSERAVEGEGGGVPWVQSPGCKPGG